MRPRIESHGAHRFALGPYGLLLAVADGMGGAAAGETAGRICLKVIYSEIQELIWEMRRPDDGYLEEILVEAVGNANRRIYDLGRRNHDLAGMGTTLTVVLGLDGRLMVGQIGDSRAYQLRQQGIRQLTRDQSLVAQRVSAGEISEEEARRHPERNILLQAVGVRPEVELALRSVDVGPGDVLLLCSDGLHAQMSADEIHGVVLNSPGEEDACLSLVDLANRRGGPDNITGVIAQFVSA